MAWLEDRYARRSAGDAEARRPFLLVASFVNPHDIVLFPAWLRGTNPLEPSPLDPPNVPPSPTADEDLRTKPAAQIAYRAAYGSGYGPARMIDRLYEKNAQAYRDLYHRLHAEVDGPLDQVRRAVTENGSENAVLVRTSDHGDVLGAHGGLHQKWLNLYDEAARVPFVIARIGGAATSPATIADMPTSHVDLLPTLLTAAGIDQHSVADELRAAFTECHPLPGRDLLPIVDDPASADPDRTVYMITRDNMLEGDSGASGVARRMGRTDRPPAPLRIQVPAHVGTNVEALVARVAAATEAMTISGSSSERSTTPIPGPSPVSATWPPTARPGRCTAPNRCPTSGSCTTSPVIRSRHTTGPTTTVPLSCSSICQPAWTTSGEPRHRSETNHGHTPRSQGRAP